MGNRGSEYGPRRGDLGGDEQADELSSDGSDLPRDYRLPPANRNDNRSYVIQDGIGRTGGIVIGIVSGLALGISLYGLINYTRDYRELERENRLLQLKVDDMRVALNSQGIETNKHAATDSP